jgi:hypothetical protein
MTQTVQEKNKEEKKNKDNFFLEMISNILIQLPIIFITWIISQFTSER